MTAPPDRTVYTCQRCLRPVLAAEVHVKTLRHIERERVSPSGRRTITVQSAEVLGVTHLNPCKPDEGEN